MNILRKLTLKHIRLNRKRATVTIIGIMLSTAMMLTIGLMFSSVSGTVKDNAIKLNGDYHIAYRYIESEKLQSLVNQSNVDSYYKSNMIAAKKIDEHEFITLNEADQLRLEQLEINEGRLPTNSNELIVTDKYYKANKLNVGDKITIEAGTAYVNSKEGRKQLNHSNFLMWDAEYYQYLETKEPIYTSFEVDNIKQYEYTVVGSYYNSYDYYASAKEFYTLNNNIDSENVMVYMKYTNPKEARNIEADTAKNYVIESEYLASNLAENYDFNGSAKFLTVSNDQYLMFYTGFTFENLNFVLGTLLSFILLILSIGCIIVIYNSFAISAIDRKREFGIYSSIGTTNNQIKYSMYFEAFILGTIGIALGMILAQLFSLSLIRLVTHYTEALMSQAQFDLNFKLYINWFLYIIPIVFMILVVFFSAYLPAKRAAKSTSIDLIKQTADIKLSSRKIKSNFIVRKLFKAEGVLAHKNMKRNKKRYRITLISLVTSLIMFLSFSTFSELFKLAIEFNEGNDYDVNIIYSIENEDAEKTANLIEGVIKDENYLKVSSMWSHLENKEDIFSDDFVEYYHNTYEDYMGYPIIQLSILALEDEVYEQVLIDNKLDSSDSIIVNNINIRQQSLQQIKFSQIKPIKNNPDSLKFVFIDQNVDKLMEFDNLAYVDSLAINGFSLSPPNSDTLTVLTSNSNLLAIGKENNATFDDNTSFSTFSNSYLKYSMMSDDPQSIIDSINSLGLDAVYPFSPTLDLQVQNNLFTLAKIIIYTFIGVTALIGITSVFNTVYTSIILRRREFAMLRSVGMDNQGFNRILVYESLLFSFKTILIAFPISAFIIIQFNQLIASVFYGDSLIIPWSAFGYSAVAVLLIMLSISLYSSKEIKKDNILEALRKEIN